MLADNPVELPVAVAFLHVHILVQNISILTHLKSTSFGLRAPCFGATTGYAHSFCFTHSIHTLKMSKWLFNDV